MGLIWHLLALNTGILNIHYIDLETWSRFTVYALLTQVLSKILT